MNAAKITLTSLIFAAALGLTLGLAPAPAEAHHCKGGHANDPDCDLGGGGGGGQNATIFDVLVTGLAGPLGGSNECVGNTNPPKLDVNFGPGCSVVMDDDTTDGLELNLFAIAVRTRNNGPTDLLLFFTSGDQLFPVPNETVYATDRLVATISLGSFPRFALDLNILAADMIKEHQPGKGDVVGQFSVGSFLYTPVE